ncbi:2OG-Fe(II) oxygenase family oxidoreductase [Colletotrichum higginsianum]|nr:2OG-Fe(II) oxygenase family oxidoreductase [Colletotrichum higginsianum]
MTASLTKLLGLAAYTGLVAVTVPYVQQHHRDILPSRVLDAFLPRHPAGDVADGGTTLADPFVCHAQNYTTQIVSLDPLVVYIHNFLGEADIAALLAAGEPAFRPSHVVKHGRTQGTPDRTSWSAGLPADDAAVRCVLHRAEAFMGTTLAPGRDEIGPPQLVRYTAAQRFNLHHDWYDAFQPDRVGGRDRRWNRVASFFAVLQDGCTGGETWFPALRAVTPQHLRDEREGEAPWRRHEDGGLAFRPVRGNAVFWVNLHANGTGDERVLHAGLPLGSGLKTAMNIWPRRYIGPEAWAEGQEPREEEEEGEKVGDRQGKQEEVVKKEEEEEEEELVVDDAEVDPI